MSYRMTPISMTFSELESSMNMTRIHYVVCRPIHGRESICSGLKSQPFSKMTDFSRLGGQAPYSHIHPKSDSIKEMARETHSYITTPY